jgi:hypothetical protein
MCRSEKQLSAISFQLGVADATLSRSDELRAEG